MCDGAAVVAEAPAGAVLLDRDGVLNMLWREPDLGLVDSPLRGDQLILLPGAAEAVLRLNKSSLACAVVSNQPAVAKRKTSPAHLEAVTEALVRRLAAHGAHLDGIYYCLHHPDADELDLRRDCENRKPAAGLLTTALADLNASPQASWMIGDTGRVVGDLLSAVELIIHE